MSDYNPVSLSLAQSLSLDEQARYRAIRRARAYDSGQQFVALTDRLRAFLSDDLARNAPDSALLRLNVIATVNNAVTERLIVKGFTSGSSTFQDFAKDVWQRNRMDARADDVHEMVIRDGECFVLVSYDFDAKLPRFTPHPRYVEPDSSDALTLDDDGYGMRAFYQDDDDNGVMLYATKRWTEVQYVEGRNGIERKTRRRITYYYPDRIEKYAITVAGLREEPITDPADNGQWPLPWVMNGKPLGIPVVHFKNANLAPEAWEAIPVQNSINKTFVDLMAASDATAFRVLIALGWEPVDADGAPLAIAPGSWVGTTNKDGKVQVVDPADLTGLLNLWDSLIVKAAMVTDTPVSRFQLTGQVAAEGTQKQQESALLGKIRKRHSLIGNVWEDVLYIARTLHNAFGAGGLDETALVACDWESAAVRDETEELARAETKLRIGIPQQQIWAELGYSEEQITQFEKANQQKADAEAARAAQQSAGAMPQQTGARDNAANA